MTWQVACAALLVAALWLAFPGRDAGLRRLSPAPTPGEAGPSGLLAGRKGAPPVGQRARLGAGAGLLVLVASPSVGWLPVAVVVGGAVTVGLGWLWPVPGPDRAVARQLPGTLELLAACLEAGASMRTAVETVGGISAPASAGVLERVAGQLRIGRSDADAWLGLAEDPAWGAVARSIARSARSGTSLVEVLLVHAEDQRRRTEAAQGRAARSAGVRSVLPLMVCFLPAFVLVGVVPTVAGLLRNFLG